MLKLLAAALRNGCRRANRFVEHRKNTAEFREEEKWDKRELINLAKRIYYCRANGKGELGGKS